MCLRCARVFGWRYLVRVHRSDYFGSSMMDANEFERLYQIMFSSTFAGYTPAVAEAPHGDGRVDVQKRYSHLNTRTIKDLSWDEGSLLSAIFYTWLRRAEDRFAILDISKNFCPSAMDSTFRLLEYPPGVGGEEHTDFNLFTVNVYRSHMDLINPGGMLVHYGELAEIVTDGRFKATSHRVLAHPTQTQRSAVFFAMPPLDAVLPTGVKVRDWVAERKARSRINTKSPLFCEHGNDVPFRCPCRSSCYCKNNTCKIK